VLPGVTVSRTSVLAAVVPPAASQACWSTIQFGESQRSVLQEALPDPPGPT
jgi:hypothetical protein